MSHSFRYPSEFPREAFVQASIEIHFLEHLKFRRFEHGHTDLACENPETGECWVIEAKGETLSIGLDFRTGLGQIVQSVLNQDLNYGLAVPRTQKFMRQCMKLSGQVRRALNLHLILISNKGEVEIISPFAELDSEELLP